MIKLKQSMQEYRASQALASSDLKILANKTPYHFYTRNDHRTKESEALNFGTLVHLALLEPEEFAAQVVVEPSIDRRTKAYKEWRASLSDEVMLCTQEEHGIIGAIRHRIQSVGLMPLLRGGDSEASVYTQHLGIDLKCRPDKLALPQRLIVDLKTTRDLKWFAKDALKYGYDFSVAHYKNCLAEEFGTMVQAWTYVFVAVENEAPYDVDWFELSREKEEAALNRWDDTIQLYQTCISQNKWPGYVGEGPKNI